MMNRDAPIYVAGSETFIGAAFVRILRDGGHEHVIEDETQAYLIAPSSKLGAASKPLLPLRRKLRVLFREHAAWNLNARQSFVGYACRR